VCSGVRAHGWTDSRTRLLRLRNRQSWGQWVVEVEDGLDGNGDDVDDRRALGVAAQDDLGVGTRRRDPLVEGAGVSWLRWWLGEMRGRQARACLRRLIARWLEVSDLDQTEIELHVKATDLLNGTELPISTGDVE